MDKKAIIDALRKVYDPEIPVNIYDLGLIYEINIDDANNVAIVMTVTAPNCPIADELPENVRQYVASIPDIGKVNVKLTFEPPWTPDKLSDEARLELGLL
ncbi:MAG: SUF system Fe-S cluster assembly protein [Bacteroidales bacterium]|jgi:FeS assembly SUF system protein|nr:SUF system Fe-S cluster assembly protein [Bacteroidales bacterium]